MSEDKAAAPVLSYLGQPLRWFAGCWILFLWLELALNVWPLQFQSLAWRYAAEGLFSSSLPALVVACLILNALALLRGKHRSLRRVIRLHGMMVFVDLVFAVDFALNALQLRDTALPSREAEAVFVAGAAKVVFKYLAFAGVQVMAALASWRWLRDNPKPGLLQLGARQSPWWLFWWPDATPPRPRRQR